MWKGMPNLQDNKNEHRIKEVKEQTQYIAISPTAYDTDIEYTHYQHV